MPGAWGPGYPTRTYRSLLSCLLALLDQGAHLLATLAADLLEEFPATLASNLLAALAADHLEELPTTLAGNLHAPFTSRLSDGHGRLGRRGRLGLVALGLGI